jgi:hypothetical protein
MRVTFASRYLVIYQEVENKSTRTGERGIGTYQLGRGLIGSCTYTPSLLGRA